MQANKFYILSTKELNHDLIEQAAVKGIQIDCIPFIQVKPIVADVALEKVKPLNGKKVTAVFTSVYGVHAVASAKPDVSLWEIYCLSGATKSAVEKSFSSVNIKSVAENALALAHHIVEDKVEDVYFFCGNARREELPDFLKKNKVKVQEMVMYQTHITSVELHREYDGIVFFSPSGVESFLLENKVPVKAILFAIGNTTAACLQHLPNQLIIGEKPDPKILIQKIIGRFRADVY
jgi:uroporphyrinogen-III synthase